MTSPLASRLNRRLLYAGVAASILVVIATALFALSQLRREALAQAESVTQNLAGSLEQTLDGTIDGIDMALQSAVDEISRQIASGHPDQKAITQFLKRQQDRARHLDLLRATNAQGEAIYGVGVPTPPLSIGDRDYFFRLRDDPKVGLVIAKPIIGKISQKWIWLMARRYNKPDGSFGGVVYASIFVEELDKLLAQFKMPPGSVIALRDAEMGLITRNTFNARSTIPIGDRRLSTPFQAALKMNPAAGTYISDGSNADGISRIYSYRRCQKYGFTVLVGIDVKEALAEWRQQAWGIAGFGSIFILASLGFSLLINLAWRRQEEAMAALRANRAELRQSEARFRLMFEHNDAVMLLLDPESGEILDANNAAAKFYGYPVAHLREMRLNQISLLPPEEVAQNLQRIRRRERNFFIVPHRFANGETRIVETYSSPIEVGGQPALFSIIHDVTERQRREEHVLHQAFYDELTNLPNRRLLSDRLSQTMAANRRSGCYGALMFLDLDNFKPLNDRHGHETGDMLLVEAADRLRNCVREMDTVARFGGDEFVVMISELYPDKAESAAQVKLIAEKIRSKLSEPYRLTIKADGGGQAMIEHRCTTSIGVTLFINHEASQDDIINRADKAMYQAKQAGRNSIRFHDASA